MFISDRRIGTDGEVEYCKRMVSNIYTHISAFDMLSDDLKLLFEKSNDIVLDYCRKNTEFNNQMSDFKLDVLKIDSKSKCVTFIEAIGWDELSEPIIYKSVKIDLQKKIVGRIINSSTNPTIYHHKWMFVMDDYDGFDVGFSKLWSEYYMNLKLYNNMKIKNKSFSSKIGRVNYWYDVLSTIYNHYEKTTLNGDYSEILPHIHQLDLQNYYLSKFDKYIQDTVYKTIITFEKWCD